MARSVLITGCSGGGKSTLLQALKRRGFAGVEEPGRRIVNEAGSGGAPDILPWVDPVAFARRAMALAQTDLEVVQQTGEIVFFDRGVIDAAVALEAATGSAYGKTLEAAPRYDRSVFLAPPWPEIFVRDEARRHGFENARQEHARIRAALLALGYDVHPLPKAPVAARVAFVLDALGA